MKLIARVNGNDEELVDQLECAGLVVKTARNAEIVLLGYIRENDNRDGVYPIPDILRGRAELRLETTEFGCSCCQEPGINTQVVCGLKGRMLAPYRIRTYHAGHQAIFSASGGVVTVHAGTYSPRVELRRFTVTAENGHARVIRHILWTGDAPVTSWQCLDCKLCFSRHPATASHDVVNGEDHWHCHGNVLPSAVSIHSGLNEFRAAITAARAKASCDECAHVHYGIVKPRPPRF